MLEIKNQFDEQVISAVKSIVGCQFVGMSYNSDVKLNKSQSAIIGGSVTKSVSGVFQVNYSYENAVNNRGLKEQGERVNFVAQSLPFGQWVENCENKLISHNGNIYLRYYGVSSEKPKVTYYINGIEASAEQAEMIKGWTAKSPSKTQAQAGVTENQVIARSINIRNITRISIGGMEYVREIEKIAA